MPRRMLKLCGLPHSALTPQPCPVRSTPDYDALLQRMVDNDGWTVVRTDPTQDRRTTSGAWESPLIKQINCHVRVVLKRPLYTRRLARDAWYIQLGDATDPPK